MSFTSTTSTTT